jgi:hypothetical protein
MMDERTRGSCLCGKVAFEITGAFESFFLCHCPRCRKDTGSAHAATLFSTTATLAWLSGESFVKTYQVPQTRHRRSFCANCGSALPDIQAGGALLATPAGCLDTAVDMRPDAHIFAAARAPWDDRLEEVPTLDGLPD